MNNKELYKKSFSKLHTSLNLEVDNMKNVSAKIVCKSVLTICLVFTAVIGLSCGVTYAVTGGETANPIAAIQILINGEDVSNTLTPDAEGNYTVELNSGDDFAMQNGDKGVKIKMAEDTNENVKLKISSEDVSIDVISKGTEN